MDRKRFLIQSAVSTGAFLAHPVSLLANAPDPVAPYKPELVKEFVVAGHGNLARVKEFLEEYPNLLYCRYDWGGGDFEEAIEGAGHVGHKEVATYLIGKGARPNLFVLAMLGETAIVRAVLERYPALLTAKGAHGFTLLHHARKGGDASRELADYLNQQGLNETQFKIK